jgi:hypothetical protein
MNQMDRGDVGDAVSIGVERVVVDLFLLLVEQDRFSLAELRRELRSSSALDLNEARIASLLDAFLTSGGLV